MHTATFGDLDLTTDGYLVTSFDARNPGLLRLRLDIEGIDEDDLVNKIRAIQTQINRATQGAQPVSGVPWVTLALQARASSTLVEYLVRGGSIPPPVIADRSMYEFEQGWLGRVDVELQCLPETLGPEIEYGPFDVTGASPTLHIDGIPGDLPALAEVRAVDQSTNGAVVNRLRWACRSLPAMDAGDFDPVLALGGGGEDPNSFTGFYASLVGGSSWQTIGSVTREASEFTSGLYDIYVRLRDATESLGTPANLELTVTEAISRRQRVYDGSFSGTSQSISFSNTPIPGNLLVLTLAIDNNVTINTPSGWTLARVVGTGPKLASFYKLAGASESKDVTVTFSGTTGSRFLYIYEYFGAASVSPLDASQSNSGSGTVVSTGTTAAMSQNSGVGLALLASEGGGLSLTTGGWTKLGGAFVVDAERSIVAGGTHALAATNSPSSAWAGIILVFKSEEPEPATVPAGTYQAKVVAVDSSGRLSAPSNAASVTLVVAGALQASWASGGGPVDDYRFYWQGGTEDFQYVVTGNSSTTFQLHSETGSITADPPAASTIIPASFRLRVGGESGETIDVVTPPFNAAIANNTWEPVYAGRSYLPPMATPLAALAHGYRIDLQGKADTNVQLDVDAVVLVPADEQQLDAQFTSGDLSASREWVLGTTPDMRSYGFLRDVSDGSEQGRVKTLGYALLGPGDTTMVFLPTVAGGVWNVEDVALSVTVIVRPRYRWLAGGL